MPAMPIMDLRPNEEGVFDCVWQFDDLMQYRHIGIVRVSGMNADNAKFHARYQAYNRHQYDGYPGWNAEDILITDIVRVV